MPPSEDISLSPSSSWTTEPLDTEGKLCPEPLAHQAVDIKVKAGVKYNEDMIEVSYTEPEPWDRVSTGLTANGYSEITNVFFMMN